MLSSVFAYLKLRRMQIGSLLFTFFAMLRVARELNDAELEGFVEEAIAFGQDVHEKELQWNQARNETSTRRGDAAVIDSKLDAQIGALEQNVRSQTVGDEGDETVALAEEFLGANFPNGLKPITQQSYEHQLATVDAMMRRFKGPFSRHVDALGVGQAVARIERLNNELRVELEKNPVKIMSFDEVNEARDEAHEFLGDVVVMILAKYRGRDEETSKKREMLLAPLNRQQARIAEAYRRQRRPLDVDPTTGVEVEPVLDQEFDGVDQPEVVEV